MNDEKKREKTSHPNMVRYTKTRILYYKYGEREISLRTKDEKEALSRIKFVQAKYEPLKGINLRLTLSDLKEPYLDSRRVDIDKGKIRQSTYRETAIILEKNILPFFGKKQPAKVDAIVWDDFRKKTHLRELTNVRKILGHMLKWCVKNKFATGVPILDIDPIKRRRRRILKPQEMKLIWDNCAGSLKLFISMALFMGMRRSEIMTLEWKRINFQEHYLFLPDYITKTKRERYVPLAAETEGLLLARLKKQQTKGPHSIWIFPKLNDPKNHAVLGALMTAWKSCKKRAFGSKDNGKLEDITWHDLRATCEAYAHRRTDLTPTQLEKFFGADIDVQRKIYVNYGADEVRGVEDSIGMKQITGPLPQDDSKTRPLGEGWETDKNE